MSYTFDLIEILGRLLPADLDGGVSTAPLSYKAWIRADDAEAWRRIAANVQRVASRLAQVRDESGALIHLDIEPEPDCLLETTDETVRFFEAHLNTPTLRDHVRVCFDCCHVSVEHEEPLQALEQYRRAGIKIGRVQLSSAIDVRLPDAAAQRADVAARLGPFADPVYLHQVVEERGGRRHQFPDLGDALRAMSASAEATVGSGSDSHWRIHFHVPLFAREYDGLGSTQHDVRAVIAAAKATGFTRHLEIETYTWDVLPPALKMDVIESIAREYDWVIQTVESSA